MSRRLKLKWNVVISKGGIGYILFAVPFDSLELLVKAIKEAKVSLPDCGGFIAVQYDPLAQLSPEGIIADRIVAINPYGDILLEYTDAFGIHAVKTPLINNS
jgi:hypothetical protein